MVQVVYYTIVYCIRISWLRLKNVPSATKLMDFRNRFDLYCASVNLFQNKSKIVSQKAMFRILSETANVYSPQ